MSLFSAFGAGGQQPQQQQQQSTPQSLFGQPAQQQTNPTTQQSPFQTSLFQTPQAGQTSLFGQTNQTGQTSLFQPNQSSQGSLFGNQTATNQSSLFQTPQASNPQPSLFGTNANTSQPSLFGTSATTNTASQPNSLFGTNTGTTTTSQPNSLFGTNTNTATTSQPSLFGTSTNTTSQPSLFGATTNTTTTSQPNSLFGTNTNTAPQNSLFGGNTNTQSSLFPGVQSSSLFPSNTSGQTSFFAPNQQQQNQQQQQQSTFNLLSNQSTTQQQQQQQPSQQLTHEQEQQQKQQREQMLQAISQPKVYNDSRDKILGDFNRVQALWGTGRAFYTANGSVQTVDLAESQPVGFHALSERYKLQQQETQKQRSLLQQLSEQLSELQKHVAAIKSKLEECRRKRVVLGNRVLKVLVMQEIENRKGFPIQADEEKLRSRMENILSELHCQTKYRGCLNELMSQLKQIQSQQHRTAQVHLDETVVDDIKEHLMNEHKAIEHLISVIKQDQKNVSSPS